MQLGLFTMNAHSCSRPGTAIEVALAAEAAGFESLWAGEHIVMPEPPVGREPLQPKDPILDPLIALAHLAGCTTTIRLATGMLILPLRNPIVLAKEIASLDVLARGRFLFGFGVGWLRPEFEAAGVPFAGRGQRSDEYLQAMIQLWTASKPKFEGDYVQFAGVQARPLPTSRPYPKIIVGGESPPALRRAIATGHGWFGGILKSERWVERQLAALRQESDRSGRPAHLGKLEITVSLRGDLDLARIERMADLGVHRLVILPPAGVHDDELRRWVEDLARRIGSAFTPAPSRDSSPSVS